MAALQIYGNSWNDESRHERNHNEGGCKEAYPVISYNPKKPKRGTGHWVLRQNVDVTDLQNQHQNQNLKLFVELIYNCRILPNYIELLVCMDRFKCAVAAAMAAVTVPPVPSRVIVTIRASKDSEQYVMVTLPSAPCSSNRTRSSFLTSLPSFLDEPRVAVWKLQHRCPDSATGEFICDLIDAANGRKVLYSRPPAEQMLVQQGQVSFVDSGAAEPITWVLKKSAAASSSSSSRGVVKFVMNVQVWLADLSGIKSGSSPSASSFSPPPEITRKFNFSREIELKFT